MPELLAPIEAASFFGVPGAKSKGTPKKIQRKAGRVFEKKPNFDAPEKPPRQNSANFATPPKEGNKNSYLC